MVRGQDFILGLRTESAYAALAKIGKVNARSVGDHKSPIEIPPHVSGADPKKPAMKRNESWKPILGDKLEAAIKSM